MLVGWVYIDLGAFPSCAVFPDDVFAYRHSDMVVVAFASNLFAAERQFAK